MSPEISKTLSESRCTKCGAPFHPTSNFCGFDGTELALCDAADYGSERPPSGKQCSTCATKYSWTKQFCGVEGNLLVPWYDPGSNVETTADAAHSELMAALNAAPKPTREQNWSFPKGDESPRAEHSQKPRDVNNLSQVDFERITESMILERAQKAAQNVVEPNEPEIELANEPAIETEPVPADKLSKVDFELVSEWVTKDQSEIAATTQMKSKRQSRELPAPIPADKLSKVDFELVTEWLTVDQSEEAVELARKIERRNKQTDLTEVAEQTLELPQAEEKEEPPKYIRPEDLDKTVESAVIRFEPAEQLLEKAADTSQDYSFADDLNLVGKVLEGKYAIKSVLAEGGMAILYLANHTTMERTVVVKVVHNYLRSSPSELLRFEREAKVVARLNHPNIVSLYDFGFIDDKLPFIVMEYIRGMNLSQKVIRHGPPRIAVAIRIIKQICFGLEEAHSCGIIHRDLKPDNIILQDKFDRPDWVKLVDFGIAHMLDNKGKRLTRAGLLIGTPEYASPEQFKDLPLDTRSDIYSLGVVFFELFAARLPFDAGSLAGLMTKILLEPAPSVCTYRSDIESGSPIDLLIQKCLEKDPEKRFQTVTEVRLAAEAAYQSE